ncbi:hypothetical protein [Microbulbifer aggregans]|uniref:hypothetical protein n=1 Tax=Microbulbifer aggregans TaxID=1769779 RepID=UPI001CFED324|nr:hypothetical protein [Microbulbifer aggregans]
MKTLFPFLTLSFICSVSAMPAFSGIELELSDARKIDVNLAEARLVGELQGYAIVAGRSCIDCDENTAIYFEKIDDDTGWSHPPASDDERAAALGLLEDDIASSADDDESAGEDDEDRPQAETGVITEDLDGERFTYPGKYRDYETRKVVEKTRMFYGNCYENSPAVLWLSEYLTEKGWVKTEYLIVFREGGVEHRYNEDRQPSIYYIENTACREVPGIAASTEP